MESVVLILMMLVVFNFIVKLSFSKMWSVAIIVIVAAIFVGLMWSYAIEQSKTQIASWLSNPELMLDTSVILSVDVILQIAFCILSAYIATTGCLKPRTLWLYRALRLFPGLMIFPVLFSLLVYTIFALPGYSFTVVSWSLAAAVVVILPMFCYLISLLLPEKEIRLELLFLTNVLVAVLGVVVTVNGRTAVAGVGDIDWSALVGVIAIVAIAGVIGLITRKIKINKITNQK